MEQQWHRPPLGTEEVLQELSVEEQRTQAICQEG